MILVARHIDLADTFRHRQMHGTVQQSEATSSVGGCALQAVSAATRNGSAVIVRIGLPQFLVKYVICPLFGLDRFTRVEGRRPLRCGAGVFGICTGRHSRLLPTLAAACDQSPALG